MQQRDRSFGKTLTRLHVEETLFLSFDVRGSNPGWLRGSIVRVVADGTADGRVRASFAAEESASQLDFGRALLAWQLFLNI